MQVRCTARSELQPAQCATCELPHLGRSTLQIAVEKTGREELVCIK